MINSRTNIEIPIGSEIGNSSYPYQVYANAGNRVVIAFRSTAPEPWVVWWLDMDGEPYGGSYFLSKTAALQEFFKRCL